MTRRWRKPERLSIVGYVRGWGDRNRIDGTFVRADDMDAALKALAAAEAVSYSNPTWNYSTQEAINAEIMRKRDAGMEFDPDTGEWYTKREIREIAE